MSLSIVLISLMSLILGIDEAEIVFAGDAMMHSGQLDAAATPSGAYSFDGYFDAVEGYVRDADYAVVNLETPVSGAPYSGYPCFNAPSAYIDELSKAGFDLFLTANNHTLDRRDRGLRATIDTLDARNLHHIGTYHNAAAREKAIPFIRNINNIRVGFLNYTYGTNGIEPGPEVKVDYIDRDLIRRDVEATRAAGAEIIVACVHWGVEYRLLPHQSQTSLADYLRKLGVEVIIGGHPHVIQPMEYTGGDTPSLLVYSLGNFISNMKTTDTRGGAMAKVRLVRGDDGKVRVADASYRLVFTEPAAAGHNYHLEWVDVSDDPRAAAFARSARAIFGKHNKNVAESHPNKALRLLRSIK